MPQAPRALQGVSAQVVQDDGSSADDRVRGFVRRLGHGWLRTTEITQEVRDYAEEGMAKMARTFRESGGEIYQDADKLKPQAKKPLHAAE